MFNKIIDTIKAGALIVGVVALILVVFAVVVFGLLADLGVR